MSALQAFGIAQAGPSMPSPQLVDPPNRLQEDQLASQPASEALEDWTCNNPYKYSNQGPTEEAFETIDKVVRKHDEDFCKGLKEEINFLMVVAGLFLAIVTAFMIESYKLLQEDKQDTISDLLVEVVRLLNNTSTQGHAQLPKRFTPAYRNIVVNQLWFLSITLSVFAVLIGTFCLQWISAYLRETDLIHKSASPAVELGMRHLRYQGFVSWGVFHAPEVLLLIVQLSITLFISGLIYFLWNVDTTAAIPAIVVAGITGILLCVVNVMPFLQSLIGVFCPRFLTFQCPYKSPTSWLVRSVWDSVVLILRPLSTRWAGGTGIRHRFASWLKCRPVPWGDYVWKVHDTSCAAMQELWNVRSSLRFFGLGLSSAFDILAHEPNAVDIIHDSIHNLRLIPEKTRFLKAGFRQSLSEIEARILNGGVLEFSDPMLPADSRDQQRHFDQMLKDFFCALIFQNLVDRSAKLCRILFQHRVELYIRIKNSSLFLYDPQNPNQFHEFSSSLTCPFIGEYNTGDLPLELKFQFLNYLIRFWERSLPTKFGDIVVAAEIISREPSEYSHSEWCPPGPSLQPSTMNGGEAPKEEDVPQIASSVSATEPDFWTFNSLADTWGMHGTNVPEHVGLIMENIQSRPSGVFEMENAGDGASSNGVYKITDSGGFNIPADSKKTHRLNASGHASLTIEQIQHGPVEVCEGTNAGDCATFTGNGRRKVTVDGSPNLGDLSDTVGKKGNEGGYCSSPEEMRRSDQHGTNWKSIESPQLRASFRRACLQVKQTLVAYATSTPRDGGKDEVLRVLGSGRRSNEKHANA